MSNADFPVLANYNDQFPGKPCRKGNAKEFLSLVVKCQGADRHEADPHAERNRQPVTSEERALAEEAKQGCPTESIGNDGLLEKESSAPLAQNAGSSTGGGAQKC